MDVMVLEKQGNVVLVRSRIGCFKGIWCSPMPEILQKYVVEIDCDEIISYNKIEIVSAPIFCIEEENESTLITGLVQDIQAGVMFLKILESLIMIEVSEDSYFQKFIGKYVRIKLNNVNLYDVGIPWSCSGNVIPLM